MSETCVTDAIGGLIVNSLGYQHLSSQCLGADMMNNIIF